MSACECCPCICLRKFAVFRRFAENCTGVRPAGARTGLPKNRACLLIMPPRAQRGISGESRQSGDASSESCVRFNKKKQTRLRDKNNGGRPRTKSTGHLPKSRSQNQNATDDLSGQWSEAAGDSHLVRQFLPAAPARRSFAACLQARDLDYHARRSDPAVRRRRGCSGLKVT